MTEVQCPACKFRWLADYINSYDKIECPRCRAKGIGIIFMSRELVLKEKLKEANHEHGARNQRSQ